LFLLTSIIVANHIIILFLSNNDHSMKAKEVIKVGQLELRFLLDGDDTNNQMVVFEFDIPPGAKVPVAHYHKEVDEMVYGLKGTMSTYINGKRTDIVPGDHSFIPRGAAHYHDNQTNELASVLCVLTPASIGPPFFREMRDLLIPGGPPDPAKVGAIMTRHGLIPAL
jgi:quercetin dioxygenase-like cupin family protein